MSYLRLYACNTVQYSNRSNPNLGRPKLGREKPNISRLARSAWTLALVNFYGMDQSTPIDVATGTIISCTFVLPCLAGHPHCAHICPLIAITGALITSMYALAKRRGQVVAGIYATSAALNCGIAGATFFSTSIVFSSFVPASLLVGIRGYVIVPLLDQTLPSRLHEQESPPRALVLPEVSSDGTVTWGTMRLHRVLDSALAGCITGSVLNTWRRSSLPFPSAPGQIKLKWCFLQVEHVVHLRA